MKFSDYFLIVYDFVKYAKRKGILVGPGRGSAGGSLVAYSLGIIDVDPIKYDLLFERFLNPERVTMPDIDIDFDSEKRGKIIDYVTEKYGRKRVASIITFNTLGAKQVVRDVGRCLDISLSIIDDVAKSINQKTLKESYEEKGRFYRLINSRDELKKLYKFV
jgi:DNA polymerase-3 subunit alpha